MSNFRYPYHGPTNHEAWLSTPETPEDFQNLARLWAEDMEWIEQDAQYFRDERESATLDPWPDEAAQTYRLALIQNSLDRMLIELNLARHFLNRLENEVES